MIDGLIKDVAFVYVVAVRQCAGNRPGTQKSCESDNANGECDPYRPPHRQSSSGCGRAALGPRVYQGRCRDHWAGQVNRVTAKMRAPKFPLPALPAMLSRDLQTAPALAP